MATGTAGTTAQQYHTRQTHFLVKKITYADDGTTVTVGKLPANCSVIDVIVHVTTAFNGNSTNTVDVGVTGNTNDFTDDTALGTVGVIRDTELATATSADITADIDCVAVVVSTASASAGVAYVIVEYCPWFAEA